VQDIANVSRIHRDAQQNIAGYQRPEVAKHIAGIRDYLESESPTIPNAIVLAFDTRVRFEPLEGEDLQSNYSRTGFLRVPCRPEDPHFEKPGFVVDGQQRLAAIRDARIVEFAICCSAFITDDIAEQTEQFILVNNAKPLPKGLIYELLPNTEAMLPNILQRRRFPSLLLDRLNRDEDSPLLRLIQTTTNPTRVENQSRLGFINYNAVLKMIEASSSDGLLHWATSSEDSDAQLEEMLKVLKDYWSAVAEVFAKSWAKPPKESRLTHGAGIVSMGALMDTIGERYRSLGVPNREQFVENLITIRDYCRWTDGYWDFGIDGQRKWNSIQNTNNDIQRLSMHLVRIFMAKAWGQDSLK